MTVQSDVLPYAAIGIAIVGPIGNFIRSSMVHGSDRQRLGALEKWRELKSIDRPEFDEHAVRIGKLENDMKSLFDGMHTLQLTLERLVVSSEGSKELLSVKLENIGHKISNMRQVVDGLMIATPRARERAAPMGE